MISTEGAIIAGADADNVDVGGADDDRAGGGMMVRGGADAEDNMAEDGYD